MRKNKGAPERIRISDQRFRKGRAAAEILTESGDLYQLRTTWIALLFHASQGDGAEATAALVRILSEAASTILGRLFAGDVSAAVVLAPEVVMAIDMLLAARAKAAG
jgi:hypothetical protein